MSHSPFVEKHLGRTWRVSKNEAHWIDIPPYNVSVMEDDLNDGRWKARLTDKGRTFTTWLDGFGTMEAAQVAVLKEVEKRF